MVEDKALTRAIMHSVLCAWEDTLHERDTLFQIARQDADFEAKYRHWEVDSLRWEATDEVFAGTRSVVEALLEGQQGAEIQSTLARAKPTRQ